MQTVVDRYLNPDAYHPDALATAIAGRIDELSPLMLSIRVCYEMTHGTSAAAEVAVQRLRSHRPGGYALFQLTTAALILARRGGDRGIFISALDDWLAGRAQHPENWANDVLDAGEFAEWLADVDPERLVPPVPAATVLTDEDRTWVKAFATARLQAVIENLEWLRDMQIDGTPGDIASQYELTAVDRHLCEATMSGADGLPDITLAFQPDGTFSGSFLSH
jgi:hypothetical protein